MSIYTIWLEAHSGVAECDEQLLGTIEGHDEHNAIANFAEKFPDLEIEWVDDWKQYLIRARKVFARELNK